MVFNINGGLNIILEPLNHKKQRFINIRFKNIKKLIEEINFFNFLNQKI